MQVLIDTARIPPAHVRSRSMPANPAPTPQDLIAAVMSDDAFPTVAAIARASGRSYQTIHRWAHGKVGAITQDDMADLLSDIELRPEDYGVKPSTEWKRRRLQRGPGAEIIDLGDTPPAWFADAQSALHAKLDTILSRLDDLEHMR